MGEIFWLEVDFEDIPSESKRRPAIIVGIIENDLFILISTTSKYPSEPPSYFDQFKIPIYNWRKFGFSKPSWGLGHRLIHLTDKELKNLVKKEDFLGYMSEIDLRNLNNKITIMHS